MPREIFGTIIKNGVPVVGACVTQSLVEPRAFNALGIVPTYQNQVETNEAGYFSMLVDVPDDPTRGWEHEFDFGDGNKRRITIGAGPSVNISAFFDPDYPFGDAEYGLLMPLIDPVTAVGNLPTIAADGSLVDAGTGIVLEQDPSEPTAARNALATGAAPNTLGEGSIDLQNFRSTPTQITQADYAFAVGGNNRIGIGGDEGIAIGSANQIDGNVGIAIGASNFATAINSMALGNRVNVTGVGAVGISDRLTTGSELFTVNITNEVAVRARGGVRLVTATDGAGVPTKTTTLDTGGVWRLNDDTSRLAQTNEIEAVSFGGAQTLTAPEQVQARDNIAAAAEADVTRFTQIVTASVNGSYTVNGLAGSVFNLTLTANSTIDFSNMAGCVVTVNLIQDATGNRTVTWSGVSWGEAGEPTLSTGAGNRDKILFDSDGVTIDGHLVNSYV